MANVNRPSGFTPVSYLNGSPWNGQARMYSIDANYATALYIGDPVISGGGADTNGVPNIAIGATTGALRGVIVGLGTAEALTVNPLNLNIIYRPASDPAVWYAMVVDDPNVIFEIQEHGAVGNTQLTAAEVGLNQIGYSGTAGNGYISGWQLANTTDATANTTATLQLRLLGLVRRTNNAFGAYAKWLVQINVHELGHGTGAAGV
jgi:hypothetical protein